MPMTLLCSLCCLCGRGGIQSSLKPMAGVPVEVLALSSQVLLASQEWGSQLVTLSGFFPVVLCAAALFFITFCEKKK